MNSQYVLWSLGSDREALFHQLCELLKDNLIGHLLKEFDFATIELFELYVHDYLRSTHRVQHDSKLKEYEVGYCEMLVDVNAMTNNCNY